MRMRERSSALKTVLLLLLPITAVLAVSSPSRAVETLPSRLSDEAFWHMVTSFSEEGGYFRFENFLSNELAFQVVIPALRETTKPDGVYLGVGPEQNFTYMAGIQPKMAFILDIRRQNLIVHLMYKALFELSSDRAEFLSRLYARKRPSGLDATSTAAALFDAYGSLETSPDLEQKTLTEIKDLLIKEHKFDLTGDDLGTIGYVYMVFVQAGPLLDYSFGGLGAGWGTPTYADLMVATDGQGQNRSYLAAEENFLMVRDMEKKNLIIPLVGDFAGPKAIRAVGDYLKEHDAVVTAFYTSNVEQYLFQQGEDWRRFYSNVATLPMDSSSRFIRSVNGNFVQNGFRSRFQSVLGSMADLIEAFQEGRILYYGHIIGMSR